MIKNRLELSYRCRVGRNLQGIYTELNKCPTYQNPSNRTIPKACDFDFCSAFVCCPLRNLTNVPCYHHNHTKYEHIELLGESCILQDSGLRGTCRSSQQCPSLREMISGNVTRCGIGRDCDSSLICCPNVVPFLSKSDQACYGYRGYAFKDVKKVLLLSPNSDKKRKVIQSESEIQRSSSNEGAGSIAALGYHTKNGLEFLCGGILISEYFILTSAHCLKIPEVLSTVRIGFQKNFHDCHNDYEISELIPHPDYVGHKDPPFTPIYNDIGLIRLSSRVEINSNIFPYCLPSSFEIPYRLTAISITNQGDIIKTNNLQQFSNAKCNDSYSSETDRLNRGINDETQFCISDVSNWNTCNQVQATLHASHSDLYGMVTAYGVASFGKVCDNTDAYGYTRIFSYLDWIEGIVWSDK